jgi:SAM-dependent methyltransferase
MSDAPADETHAQYLARVRAYYSASLRAYLDDLGTTWQGGLLAEDDLGTPAALDPRRSNLRLARRAGVRAGLRVLDAGCGVCGPAIDIASACEGVTIDGVTLGCDQAREARRRIDAAGLAARVRVVAADFHALPFVSACFDLALFFESSGYAHDLARLLGEVRRVLRPGGGLYVKGVFLPEGELSAEERRQFELFDAVYAHRSRRVSEFTAALGAAGFSGVTSAELNARISSEHYFRALFRSSGDGQTRLTPFGAAHHRDEFALRPIYAEVRATAPGA